MEDTPMKNLFAGIDFPDAFSKDNFASRRTTGNNAFDPEGFITGAELDKGLTYANSRRAFSESYDYDDAVQGLYTVAQIADFFPRVRLYFVDIAAIERRTVRQVMDDSENGI
jgi:hypothetical protein